MRIAEPVASSWRAELSLRFQRHAGRSALVERRHDGPLVVQKPFYPEGDEVCHAIVVHPPGGVAGGDELSLCTRVEEDAAALLTTPAAGKWYRSSGAWAAQALEFEVGGTLEWLPQETIVFNGALADFRCAVKLAPHARYLGWEILCFGRSGSGEKFERGRIRVDTRITRDGELCWFDRGRLDAGGPVMRSAAGLGGRTVCGTLVAAAPGLEATQCRDVAGVAVTALRGLLVGRYLGDSSEEAKQLFVRLWRRLRPKVCGREAVEPRIWRT